MLGQVRAFLPQMAKADTELKERMNNAPDELNIENVENHDGPLIQMV